MFLLSSLKLECEKLAGEKTEMQRHYVMVSSDRIYQTLLWNVPCASIVSGGFYARFLAVVALMCVQGNTSLS